MEPRLILYPWRGTKPCETSWCIRYAIFMLALTFNHVLRMDLNAGTRFWIVLVLKQQSILTQKIQLRGGIGMAHSREAHHSTLNLLSTNSTYSWISITVNWVQSLVLTQMCSMALIMDICSMSVCMLKKKHSKKINVSMLRLQKHCTVIFISN